ncbi:MAG: ferredoxin [Gaiellaceae bacterium]|jgi:ferredoxin
MFQVRVDRDLCSGFAACVSAAPEIFELDDSAKARVLVATTDDERALDAAAGCPMSAISVFDAESGDRVA